MIAYKEFGCEMLDQVMELYQSENWSIYTDPDKVRQAFENSLYILGAFKDEKLLGFIRCISDGAYDLYVSDLIVHKAYRRQGIGTSLFRMTADKYRDIENFVLITGLDEESNRRFYQSMGMKELMENRLIGYIR